jgi:hypothetical protein
MSPQCRARWRLAARLCFLLVISASFLPSSDNGLDADASSACNETTGVQWGRAIEEALLFNAAQNGFRVGTQDYTRSRLGGKFFDDWGRSIGNLHGWADGDVFFTNYVLHPMQGSINGFIFVQNDPKYRCAVFGKNREYWKSRARATLFAFAGSEALELGPISEASIGNAQHYYPQWGLVDHVITPTVGLSWMIAEDFLDRDLVTRIENRTRRKWVRAVARSVLNPSRSMANLMAFRTPWYRYTRSNQLKEPVLESYSRIDPPETPPSRQWPKFELAPAFNVVRLDVGHATALTCVGGGATATYNLTSWFGISADVDGCKMFSAGPNISGDSLTYVLGPRFTYRKFGRWLPYAEFLIGGDKLSTETVDPARKPVQTGGIPEIDLPAFHQSYTSQAQTNSFAIKSGVGIDGVVNDGFAFQLVRIDDVHLWARTLNGRNYPHNVVVTTGVVVRFGTW